MISFSTEKENLLQCLALIVQLILSGMFHHFVGFFIIFKANNLSCLDICRLKDNALRNTACLSWLYFSISQNNLRQQDLLLPYAQAPFF
jgi:hypothetical protein